MEKEDKILEAMVRQHQDTTAQLKDISEQNSAIIKKLEVHDEQFEKIDGRFNRIETVVLDNSKDIKDVKNQLDTAITNHEQRIRKIEV